MTAKRIGKVIAILFSAAVIFSVGGGYIPAGSITAEAAEITAAEPSTDENGIYQIGTAEELYWFDGLVNGTLTDVTQNTSANAVLTADIVVNTGDIADCGGTNSGEWVEWTPVGIYGYYYKGIFDGQGYTISGLYYYSEDNSCVGLFGAVSGAEIKNVGIKNSYLYGSQYVGGICGFVYGSSTITNCFNEGTITAVTSCAGGICGYLVSGSSISGCYSTGTVSSTGKSGGICGQAAGTISISNCCYLSGSASGFVNGTTFQYTSYIKTEAQFESGEVTYLLNGSSSDADSVSWYQNIGSDSYPVLDSTHSVVYYYSEHYLCPKYYETVYTNFSDLTDNDSHTYVDGYCKYCGLVDPSAFGDLNIVNGVCQIADADDLYLFAKYVNAGYMDADAVLTADIVVNDGEVADWDGVTENNWTAWTPIGYSTDLSIYYSGTFDGQGHTISGLFYSSDSGTFIGLFALAYGAEISNVGVINSYFSTSGVVGGICGLSAGSTISNCYNTGTIVCADSGSYAGGICGESEYCTVRGCYSTGIISCDSNNYAYAAGIASSMYSVISNCCYLEGTAAEGAIDFIDSEISGVEEVTEAQFKSGYAAWLLSDEAEGTDWLQTIGTDSYPVLAAFNSGSLPVVEITSGSDTVYANVVTGGVELRVSGSELLGVVIDTDVYGGEGAAYLNGVGVVIDGILYELNNYYYIDGDGNYSEEETGKAFFPVSRNSESAGTVESVRGEAATSTTAEADENLLYFVTSAVSGLTINEAANAE
ncbi:MAG: hypothetical protein LUG66_02760 [Clostridiales bacterium]|nr:hypothetical protein [Clostridiales bacterium]